MNDPGLTLRPIGTVCVWAGLCSYVQFIKYSCTHIQPFPVGWASTSTRLFFVLCFIRMNKKDCGAYQGENAARYSAIPGGHPPEPKGKEENDLLLVCCYLGRFAPFPSFHTHS